MWQFSNKQNAYFHLSISTFVITLIEYLLFFVHGHFESRRCKQLNVSFFYYIAEEMPIFFD